LRELKCPQSASDLLRVEVFDAEMAALRSPAEEAKRYISNSQINHKPDKIIYADVDNCAAIAKIFEGTRGKSQDHSRE